MKASEMMNSYVVVMGPADSVERAAQSMRDEKVGFICVCDEEQHPLGIVTDRDLATRVCASSLPPQTTAIRRIMSPSPVTCRLDTTASDIEAIMTKTGLGRILVIDEDGALAGVVTLAEIWHYESPLSAAPASRRVTERGLRLQSGMPLTEKRGSPVAIGAVE